MEKESSMKNLLLSLLLLSSSVALQASFDQQEEQVAMTAPLPESFVVGQRVCIKGIQKKPELNDRMGKVISFDEEKGRYGVSLLPQDLFADPKVVEQYSFSPRNLQSTEYLRITNPSNTKYECLNSELRAGHLFKVEEVNSLGVVRILQSTYLFDYDRGTFYEFVTPTEAEKQKLAEETAHENQTKTFYTERTSKFKNEFELLSKYAPSTLEGDMDKLWILRGIVLENEEASAIAKQVDREIFQRGGHEQMLRTHEQIKLRVISERGPNKTYINSFPRELESVWDGIGDWLG